MRYSDPEISEKYLDSKISLCRYNGIFLSLDESDEEEDKKAAKKRGGYDKDDDFDTSATKKDDDEFAPDTNRYFSKFFFMNESFS